MDRDMGVGREELQTRAILYVNSKRGIKGRATIMSEGRKYNDQK